MPSRALHLAGLLLLLVLVPSPVHAAPGIVNPATAAPVDLFFHLGGFQDFPINTQEPPASYVTDAFQGPTTTSTGCLPASPAGTGQAFHTLYGFSSPGLVEYGFVESGRPRYHPERDLSYDVVLAGATLHWFVATQAGTGAAVAGADPDSAPMPAPQVTVRATLRTGEAIRVDGGGFDDGQVLASGQSAPVVLAGPATAAANPHVNWTVVGGRNVYEVVVPLDLAEARIPAGGGFALRVDTFVDLPGPCEDPAAGYVMPHTVQVHSSPAHRPRLAVLAERAVRLDYVHPQFVGDLLYIHTAMNTPWGNYDIDVRNITVDVRGPTQASSLRLAAFVQRTHEHGHHTEAVDVTFEWPFRRDQAADGTYTITMAVPNRQHTAVAAAEATFKLGPELEVLRCGEPAAADAAPSTTCILERQDERGNVLTPSASSPAWPALGALGSALAAAAWRRRRLP